MSKPTETPKEVENTPEDGPAPAVDAGYATHTGLGFDPLKELNLPSSYDEVRQRFHRLQGGKEGDLLN